MMTTMELIKSARRASTPLMYVNCPDPAATIQNIMKSFDGATPLPFVMWDVNQGMSALNPAGSEVLKKLLSPKPEEWPGMSSNPGTALSLMLQLPGERREGDKLVQRGTIVFMLNPQMLWSSGNSDNTAIVTQAIWNLRDPFKGNRRAWVGLGYAGKIPTELAQDIVVFDEQLPEDAELSAIVTDQLNSAGLKVKPEQVAACVDAVRGLPAFPAEQISAMSIKYDEKFNPVDIDVDTLWQRKIAVLEQVDGVSVYKGSETFDDIGGLEALKEFGLRLISSKRAPVLYVMIDEGEKFFAGLGQDGGPGDNTGTTQDTLGVLLRNMEDNGWNGQINVGHAGTSKTLFAKAIANEATRRTGRKVLLVNLDLGETKASRLGETERKIRAVMSAFKSMARDGRVYFIMNCNNIDVIPPAFKRRFRRGTWMFELPTKAEKEKIWGINLKRFEIATKDARPDDESWTGADIRNCCETADDLSIPLKEAVKYLVIAAKTDPTAVDVLRRKADGKFLSANKPGLYSAEYLTESKGQSETVVVQRRIIGREDN